MEASDYYDCNFHPSPQPSPPRDRVIIGGVVIPNPSLSHSERKRIIFIVSLRINSVRNLI